MSLFRSDIYGYSLEPVSDCHCLRRYGVIAVDLATDPKLVWDAHFRAEIAEAGIFPELDEERMGLYRERPDVSLACFVEGLEGFFYLAERRVNENLRVGQGSLSLKAFKLPEHCPRFFGSSSKSIHQSLVDEKEWFYRIELLPSVEELLRLSIVLIEDVAFSHA